ncbi:hypothetical protein DRQ18_01620 [bacterium]|nr:MAG: hypothetical protein DRQ18_01620 [bacterium]
MKIGFLKGVATGNDFVLIEDKGFDTDWDRLAKTVLHRKKGVGGDGLLVLSRLPEGYKMRIFNPDGSEPEFCGNGARLVVLYLKDTGMEEIVFYSKAGRHRGRMRDTPEVEMPEGRIERKVDDGVIVRAGVPHLVVEVEDVNNIDVVSEGRKLSKKYGVNVDFFEGREKCRIRTYERGVEDETESCGSGVASVYLYLHEKYGIKRMEAETKGGMLTAWMEEKVWIKGEARFVFKGEMEVSL